MLSNPLKKKKNNEKSRKIIKPTSLGRQQNRSRTKLRIDQNQFKKFTNKALLVEPQGRKSNLQHQRSIIQTEEKPKKISPGIKKKYRTNQVQSAIFKSDIVRKRDSHSALEGKKTSKERIGKAKKARLVIESSKNTRGAKSGLSIYPDIPDELLPSLTSSEIFFSSYGQSRDEVKSKATFKSKKPSFDNIDPNLRLEISIKREYRRKEVAATKIQKIWRGFQTRKILDFFVNNQFSKLFERMNQLKSNRQQLSIGHENDRNQFYSTFVDVQMNFTHKNHRSISNDMSVASKHYQDFSSIEYSHIDNDQTVQLEPRSNPQDGKNYREPENQQEEEDGYEDDEDEDDQDLGQQIYPFRHQKPIYSHEDLDQFYMNGRGQSQDQQEQSDEQNQDEESHDQSNKYQPEIIHQTQQQYIQSRKNSIQNKNFNHTERRISTECMNPANTISEQVQKQKEGNSDQVFQTIEVDTKSTKEQYKQELKRLKQLEIQRWTNMIQYMKGAVTQNKSKQLEDIFKEVIIQSEANRKWLENNNAQDSFNSGVVKIQQIQVVTTEQSKHQNEDNQKKGGQKPCHFWKKDLKINISEKNPYSPINQPIIKSKNSELQQTLKSNIGDLNSPVQQAKRQQMIRTYDFEAQLMKKQGFNSNAVDAIIDLRENMLKEREKAENQKIYELLQNKKISEHQFELMLMKLTKFVEDQRQDINKSKKQIEKGLKVAAKVIAKAEKDAHLVGKRIGVSKSAQNLKPSTKLNSFILLSRLGEQKQTAVFVDQGRPVPNPRPVRNFFVNETDSNSDELNFTEQQFEQFNKPKPPNQFAGLNGNIIITQQFLRGEQSFDQPISQHEIQQSDMSHCDPRIEEYVNQVAMGIQQRMLNEAIIEFYRNSTILQTLSNKFDAHILKPKKVTKAELNQFITQIFTNLPAKNVLMQRLNQQICPPPLELLKCMRVDLYPIDFDQDQNIEDVGKYQFIIPQAICVEAIQKLSSKRIFIPSSPRNDLIDNLTELDPDLVLHLQQRQRFSKLKQQQLIQKSKEVFQTQMHCLFDCWNQQIIISKSEVAGFSGIGLNQGTLSLQDQNKIVDENFVQDYVNLAKQKLLKIINQDSLLSINKRIDKMAFQQICSNEGAWVCYTDEALGFILELDFVIFQELIIEMARIMHKRRLSSI